MSTSKLVWKIKKNHYNAIITRWWNSPLKIVRSRHCHYLIYLCANFAGNVKERSNVTTCHPFVYWNRWKTTLNYTKRWWIDEGSWLTVTWRSTFCRGDWVEKRSDIFANITQWRVWRLVGIVITTIQRKTSINRRLCAKRGCDIPRNSLISCFITPTLSSCLP